MRIVNRETFIALPPGTLFSTYKPCVFGELRIKGDSIIFEFSNDFFYQDIADAIDNLGSEDRWEKLDRAKETGCSLAMNFTCQARDGTYDYDELYAVWEIPDVKSLIARLEQALRDYDPEMKDE